MLTRRAAGSRANNLKLRRLTGAPPTKSRRQLRNHRRRGVLATIEQLEDRSMLAPISIAAHNTPYSQNFDSMPSSGTSSMMPAGWEFLESGAGSNTTYTASDGQPTIADTYSFGSSPASDRALGSLSDAPNSTIGASFVNNTGSAITSLAINYAGEQWRLGDAARVDRLDFQYSLNATSLNTGTWVDVDQLDFNAPITTGSARALNGNVDGRVPIAGAIGGINVPNGATIYIRWSNVDVTGNEDGLAIDDVTIKTTGTTNVAPTIRFGDVSGKPGDLVQIPVLLTTNGVPNVPMFGFEITALYDTNILQILPTSPPGPGPGPVSPGNFTVSAVGNSNEPGKLSLNFALDAGISSARTDFLLGTVNAVIKSTAMPGTTPFNMVPSVVINSNTIVTQVNEGAFFLNPAPTTFPAEGNDASVTITTGTNDPPVNIFPVGPVTGFEHTNIQFYDASNKASIKVSDANAGQNFVTLTISVPSAATYGRWITTFTDSTATVTTSNGGATITVAGVEDQVALALGTLQFVPAFDRRSEDGLIPVTVQSSDLFASDNDTFNISLRAGEPPMIRMEVQIVAAGTNNPIDTINKGGFYEMRIFTEDLATLTYMGTTRPAVDGSGQTRLGVHATFFDVEFDTSKSDVQTNDNQVVTITGTPTTNGTFSLTVNDGGTLRTTVPITFAADRGVTGKNIQAALNTLLKPIASSPDVVEVVHEPITGSNNRWRVRFINRLGSQDVPEMTGNVSGLGTASLAVTEAISGEPTNPAAFADAIFPRTRYDAAGIRLNDDPPHYTDQRGGSRLNSPTKKGINDLGGSDFSHIFAGFYPGTWQVEIARIRMDAKEVGLVDFKLSYEDVAVGLESGLVGFNNPVTPDLIEIINDTLTITELIAGDDVVNTTEGATAFIDIPVLSNDVNNPSTPSFSKTIQSINTAGTLGNVQILPGNTILRYTPPGGDVHGVTTFTYTVSDPSGGTDTATVTVNIAAVNDAPTLAPIGNPPALSINSGTQTIDLAGILAGGGETQKLSVTATSSNPWLIPNPTVTYTSANAAGTLSYTPVTGQLGTAVITVTVMDDGGTVGGGVNETTQTFTVTVNGSLTTPGFVGIVDDPENPGQRLLVINGSSQLDLIRVLRRGSDQTLVFMPPSGLSRTFVNNSFDRYLINALDGNDRVFLDPLLSKPATINGGDGNDLIMSGGGGDVIRAGSGTDFIWGRGGNDFIFGDVNPNFLFGEDGNDVLLGGNDDDLVDGGAGSDVLSGGAGFDMLAGSDGDDLIIGGNLSQANDLAGLQSIQALWTANQPFNTRISSLAGEINLTTVTSDNQADSIFGNDGRDWLVDYALLDLLWDLNLDSDTGDRRN